MPLEFCTIEALNLRPGSKDLEAFNVERVRGYLESNLGCTKKEVIHALGLNPRTVAKAIKIIRARSSTYGPARPVTSFELVAEIWTGR
jgi:hypothetical protein